MLNLRGGGQEVDRMGTNSGPARGRVRNGVRRPWWTRSFKGCLVAVVLVLLAAPLVAPVGVARADLAGIPTYQGAFVADGGRLLVFPGIVGFGGVFTPISSNSQVFGAVLVLVIYDLTGYNLTFPVSLAEKNFVDQQTATVVPASATVVNLNTAQSTAWQKATVNVGGTLVTYQVATPVSLLPNSIANVGGLDLLVLAVVSEAVIAFSGVVVLARFLMRKALWAPRFSLLIWGHVILVGIVAAVILDYQIVDSIFAGWSPLVYVGAISPMVFAFALSLFNQAPPALLLRANAPLAGKLTYTSWPIRVTRDAKGRMVLVRPTWGGFWARLFGHQVVLEPAESRVTQPEPFVADVVRRRVVARAEWVRRVRRKTPGKAFALDDFEVIPASVDGTARRQEEVLPVRLYWTPVGQPVDVEWPRLTIHRTANVPETVNEEGEVTTPAHSERHLAWPHYSEGHATITLAPIHYRSQQSVVAEWRTAEDLAQVLSATALDLTTLKASFESEVARKVQERLVAREALLNRTPNDLDEFEAAQEAERTRDSLLPLDTLISSSGALTRELDTTEKRRHKKGGRS